MQWAKHEINNNGVVKCPLCRDEKPPEIMREIKQKEYEIKEQQIAKKVGSKDYNYYCDGCELREIDPN
jgi:predicted SprT family Zn-dependent metalloprotease